MLYLLDGGNEILHTKILTTVRLRRYLQVFQRIKRFREERYFFTLPISALKEVKSRDISQSNLLAFNIRATNDFKDKTYAIHVLNVFSNVTVSSYLKGYGFVIDEDAYALNTAIQWLFRGCIRERKKMKVTFLSKRMNAIFKEWLLK